MGCRIASAVGAGLSSHSWRAQLRFGPALAGRNGAVLGAGVETLAVDGHRRCHHDLADVVFAVGQNVQQHTGAAGVGLDVAGDLVHRLSHTDFGGQVQDLLDARHSLGQGVAVACMSPWMNSTSAGRYRGPLP